jgi:hypothetical protein
LNKVLKKAVKIRDDGITANINCKHKGLTFDHIINATDGCATGVSMRPVSRHITIYGLVNSSIITEKTYDINYLHRLIGHYGQEKLNSTMKIY